MNTYLPLITSAFILWHGIDVRLATADKTSTLSRIHDAAQLIDRDELKEHVDILADDTFEGRAAGTRGGKAAAGYLREALNAIGVEPIADHETLSHPFRRGCQNLIGVIPGSDAAYADSYILIGAHYDHVGYGNNRNSYGPTGFIHNGADDNASGTAALLEITEALKRYPPRRSVIVALWDAEEQGLLGSKHFVAEPPVPLGQIKFAINMDMVGRLRDNLLTVYGTRTWPGARCLLTNVNSTLSDGSDDGSLELGFDWEIKANSDHYPFFNNKIPYLMPHTGLHDDYHRPRDDSHKINVGGIAKVSKYVFRCIHAIDSSSDFPEFRAASGRETKRSKAALERPVTDRPKRLGVRWRASGHVSEGILVTRVASDSPAARAGISRGDMIVAVNGSLIHGDEDMRAAILSSPVECVVEVIEPDTLKARDVEITLRGTPVRIGISWRHDDAEKDTVVLTEVIPGSPAYRAGLRCADRIHEVGSLRWSSFADEQSPFSDADFPLRILYERNGQLKAIELQTLAPDEQTAGVLREKREGS